MAHGWTSTKKIYLDRFAEVFAESQANYIASAISYARAHSVTALEPTPDAQQDFAAKVDRLSDGTVWTSGGCRSWYLNANGRNTNLWPGSTFSYRRMTRRFNPDHYVLHRPLAPAATSRVGRAAAHRLP